MNLKNEFSFYFETGSNYYSKSLRGKILMGECPCWIVVRSGLYEPDVMTRDESLMIACAGMEGEAVFYLSNFQVIYALNHT